MIYEAHDATPFSDGPLIPVASNGLDDCLQRAQEYAADRRRRLVVTTCAFTGARELVAEFDYRDAAALAALRLALRGE